MTIIACLIEDTIIRHTCIQKQTYKVESNKSIVSKYTFESYYQLNDPVLLRWLLIIIERTPKREIKTLKNYLKLLETKTVLIETA